MTAKMEEEGIEAGGIKASSEDAEMAAGMPDVAEEKQ